MKLPDAVGPTQASILLGISRGRVHQLIKAGLLPTIKWGGYYMITLKEIEKRKSMKAKRKARDE